MRNVTQSQSPGRAEPERKSCSARVRPQRYWKGRLSNGFRSQYDIECLQSRAARMMGQLINWIMTLPMFGSYKQQWPDWATFKHGTLLNHILENCQTIQESSGSIFLIHVKADKWSSSHLGEQCWARIQLFLPTLYPTGLLAYRKSIRRRHASWSRRSYHESY